jgi:hypothetical protein
MEDKDPSLGNSSNQTEIPDKSTSSGDKTQTDSPISAINEEQMREAMAKVDYDHAKIAPEKASWVSRLMTLFATVLFGSPDSYGMKPSFFNLPFERVDDQTPARPGDFDIQWVRNNFYINDFRFRMLNGFALPVAIFIFVLTFAIPASIKKFESWNNNRLAENAEEARKEANDIFKELGQPSMSSCEKVLDFYNDFTADRLKVALANNEIEKENSKQPMDKQKEMKPLPDSSKLSPKKQAYLMFGQQCQGQFYDETKDVSNLFKMTTRKPAAAISTPAIPSTTY